MTYSCIRLARAGPIARKESADAEAGVRVSTAAGFMRRSHAVSETGELLPVFDGQRVIRHRGAMARQ